MIEKTTTNQNYPKPDVNNSLQDDARNIENALDMIDQDIHGLNRAITDSGMLAGGIIMWSGAADNIPQGWALCDGTNGTPDLRNRFIVGAGNTYNPGTTGGEETVALTAAQMPVHNHSITSATVSSHGHSTTGPFVKDLFGAKTCSDSLSTVQLNVSIGIGDSGGNQPHENMPPYYALCFIMKL